MWKKEVEKLQQLVYVKCKIEELMTLLDINKSPNDEVVPNQPIYKHFREQLELLKINQFLYWYQKMRLKFAKHQNFYQG